MDPGQALQLAEEVDGERGTTRLLYQALVIVPLKPRVEPSKERLVRSLRVLLSKYDPETDDGQGGNKGILCWNKRVIGIVKSQERQVRPEHIPLGPPPPPNPEHFPYEAFASNDVWDSWNYLQTISWLYSCRNPSTKKHQSKGCWQT